MAPPPNDVRFKGIDFVHPYAIDIRGFTGLETPNELHNRGALTDAHAHAALIILMAVKGDQYSLLSRQLK